ncbi:MAG: M48 family metallopeptidase [Candidatus Kerfeldbacteria bacterium]|nr:M48 family metallopeptidase [Candidatus Kerfeldbacteria bacterium]
MWQWLTVRRVRVVRRRVQSRRLKGTTADYQRHKLRAVRFVQDRLALLNQSYGFTYHRVTIRNQASRWGSCSKQGNLNFHYKIVLLPPALADYVLVHELCHVQELNHSKRFWQLVARTVPDYMARRKAIQTRL